MSDSNSTREYYTYRLLARIVIEAKTPIAIGTGEKDIITDSTVARDVNGLPYIPGTAIAGVVRHALGEEYAKVFFGIAKEKNSKNGGGSEVIFTEARMVADDCVTVLDGFQNIDYKIDFYSKFKYLPIRQHVRIDDKGIAAKGGKFDQQVVYKGTRFCFEVELVAKSAETQNFNKILNELYAKTFRLGGGTRNGYGELGVVSMLKRVIDLTNVDDRNAYINKSSNLSKSDFWRDGNKSDNESCVCDDSWTKYTLKISPVDFFLFSSGFEDAQAKIVPIKEDYIKLNEYGKLTFENSAILIPASSVKGALRHRTTYHYNRLTKCFADSERNEQFDKLRRASDLAIAQIFGSDGNDGASQTRGNVIFSDVIETRVSKDKILNHVAIDRFTGGAISGALFSEKATYISDNKQKEFTLEILAKSDVLRDEKKEAFETALNDIRSGFLPLGGGVNRGHGVFEGKLLINGKEIENETN